MRSAAALVLLALSAPALAVDVPQGSPRDHRIQLVSYHPEDVVRISARAGYVSRIVLEPGERIENPVAGFPAGWSLEPAGHILFVRPMSVPMGTDQPAKQPTPGEWDTNLVISTDRGRLYDFDLRLVGPGDAREAFYRVAFEYPNETRVRARAERDDQDRRAGLQAALDRLPAPRNTNYSMSVGEGSEAIAPTLAYDDGTFTYLRFPGNVEMPAVFVIGADGGEGTANTRVDSMRSDVLVVDRVARELVLRLGRAVVAIHNDAFDPVGVSPENGSTVPGIVRTTAPGMDRP